MSEKQRGEINVAFPKGFFREFSGFEPIQLYQIYEREIHVGRSLETLVFEEGSLLIYGVAGSAKLKIKSETFALRENSVIICMADQSCVFEQVDRKKGFRYVCFNLHITEKNFPIPSLTSLCDYYLSANRVLYVPSVPELKPIVTNMISEMCIEKNTSASLVRGMIYQLLVWSYRHINQAQTGLSDRDMTAHAVGHTAYAIIRYVDEHLCSMNNLTDMAKELGYSYNYLSHLFRRKTGMTIQAYVSQKKIEKSVELLSDSVLSITEIATMLNYDCIQSFSKAFKRTMGLSPTEYRVRHGIYF